ncbi:hypothetical protein EVG20_g4295 [Dentipellis fragilis]|uniref:Major facilitator superfamily (MFS) profile domain-containing protein n=1 Tax=Dentipellis fragilis TaxID=205917 RepID=A0A4Y9YYZ1_9AGAM|nr:hypothetical protein EVG20_g4295 [Dentipellis fragilis]
MPRERPTHRLLRQSAIWANLKILASSVLYNCAGARSLVQGIRPGQPSSPDAYHLPAKPSSTPLEQRGGVAPEQAMPPLVPRDSQCGFYISRRTTHIQDLSKNHRIVPAAMDRVASCAHRHQDIMVSDEKGLLHSAAVSTVSDSKVDEHASPTAATLAEFTEEIARMEEGRLAYHANCPRSLTPTCSRHSANIGNARVPGMYKSLGLTSTQYNAALSVFFVGYAIFETLSNIILRRTSPRFYIPALTVVWGVICALFALVHRRSLQSVSGLGLRRQDSYPASSTGLDAGIRDNYKAGDSLFCTLTGAFGGLLATAIHTLDGAHGIEGWRWIHIVEGCTTAGLGLLTLFFMIISAFTDWRTYLWGLIYISTYIHVYSVILSLPSVVTGLGYKGTTATLMACPPYGFGFVIVLVGGWTADRYKRWYWHYIVGVCTDRAHGGRKPRRALCHVHHHHVHVPPDLDHLGVALVQRCRLEQARCRNGVHLLHGQHRRHRLRPDLSCRMGPSLCPGARRQPRMLCDRVGIGNGAVVVKRDALRDEKAAEVGDEAGVKEGNMLGEELGDLGDRHSHFRYYL